MPIIRRRVYRNHPEAAFRRGPFYLGEGILGWAINITAICGTIFVAVLLCLPTVSPVTQTDCVSTFPHTHLEPLTGFLSQLCSRDHRGRAHLLWCVVPHSRAKTLRRPQDKVRCSGSEVPENYLPRLKLTSPIIVWSTAVSLCPRSRHTIPTRTRGRWIIRKTRSCPSSRSRVDKGNEWRIGIFCMERAIAHGKGCTVEDAEIDQVVLLLGSRDMAARILTAPRTPADAGRTATPRLSFAVRVDLSPTSNSMHTFSTIRQMIQAYLARFGVETSHAIISWSVFGLSRECWGCVMNWM